MTDGIEPVLYADPQDCESTPCPVCGGATYAPEHRCIRCERGGFSTLAELSKDYEYAALLLRGRLRTLRRELAEAEDPEEIWHLKRRIFELTPMLTQMNELAELTAHYYERGYYRSEKYTL